MLIRRGPCNHSLQRIFIENQPHGRYSEKGYELETMILILMELPLVDEADNTLKTKAITEDVGLGRK